MYISVTNGITINVKFTIISNTLGLAFDKHSVTILLITIDLQALDTYAGK
jgi:hypothetical protein